MTPPPIVSLTVQNDQTVHETLVVFETNEKLMVIWCTE